jgi:dimethylamine/trimethylamine dehydrogenase
MLRHDPTARTTGRDPRFDILFEPVRIGPVTAPNRFYQVPHCNGMGWLRPQALAAMRAVKAEGGWAEVCTEQVEIHHTSELIPIVEGRLWDDADLPVFQRMTERIHAHGSLAGIEPCYDGLVTANRYSREVPMAPSARPVFYRDPVQARAMDLADIRAMRRWYVDAARRARRAGFDIIYVYAGHDLGALSHFLSRRHNDRTDAYGGSLENRVRLLREVLIDTKEAVGDTCAIALRFGVDELLGDQGLSSEAEGRDVVEMLAELPDLWDVNLSGWENDSMTARFAQQGFPDSCVAFVDKVTTKPLVTVARCTSPDAMAALIRARIADFAGAARPSIADPFLPKKIAEGRIGGIRACIGCNVRYAGDGQDVPIRRTQKPAMGEEWRRGRHAERVPPRRSAARVPVVGAGPAGREAARMPGPRARRRCRGRAATSGCATFARRSLRSFRTSRSSARAGMPQATCSTSRRITSPSRPAPPVGATAGTERPRCRWPRTARRCSPPTTSWRAACPRAPPWSSTARATMAAAIAERLAGAGLEVTSVTPADSVVHQAGCTLERWRLRTRLMRMGVGIVTGHALVAFDGAAARLVCEYTGAERALSAAGLVMVTQRAPRDRLRQDLLAEAGCEAAALPFTLARIGDGAAPRIIAAAVHAGHRYGVELEMPAEARHPARHERPALPAAAADRPQPGRPGPFDQPHLRLDPRGPGSAGMAPVPIDPAGFLIPPRSQHMDVPFSDPAIGLSVGVWDRTTMQEAHGPYPGDEFIVLEGAFAMVDDRGRGMPASAGQSVVFRNGTPTSWLQPGYLRKLFLPLQDPGSPPPRIDRSEGGMIVLDPDAPLTDADTVGVGPGGARQRERVIFTNDAGTMTVGLWDTGTMTTEPYPFPRHEFAQVLAGLVTLTGADGAAETFGPGDVYFIAQGTVTRWHVPSYLRKCYAAVEPRA